MKKKILIIDDDIDIINAYSAFLSKEGMDITYAMNTDEGDKKLSEENPDLIILDVMMNEPDEGFQYAQELLERRVKTPIIITSSIAKAGIEIFDMNIPNVKYILQKPVDPQTLLKSVNRAIGLNELL